jgi:predicted RNA-binding Zn ribbon-like protein
VSAAYTLIDGLEVPVAVSGHVGLELCNTFAGWNGPPSHEYLQSYEHLATWAGSAGLLTVAQVTELKQRAAAHPGEAAAALADATDARARLYEVLLNRATPVTFDRLAQDVQAAGAHLRLVRDGDIHRAISLNAGLATPLHAAMWQASEMLVSPALSRVRACPGTGCGWLFVDRSGRRRWCTMDMCGNRAKARRFAARQRESR